MSLIILGLVDKIVVLLADQPFSEIHKTKELEYDEQ